jgi:hypothetical protein
MIAVVKESLGQLVTDGRQTGRVVMLVAHSITFDRPAVFVELASAVSGRPPVDLLVPADDPQWRPVPGS